LDLNVQRLKTYLSKLLLYPLKVGKFAKGGGGLPVADSQSSELQNVTQLRTSWAAASSPVPNPAATCAPVHEEPRELTPLEKKWKVYEFMRKNRRQERIIGYMVKRANRKAKQAEGEQKKK